MTVYAKYFYGFLPETAPAISFKNPGDRDALLRDRRPGDLIVFVGSRRGTTLGSDKGKLLGLAEIGDVAVDTEDLVDVSTRPQSHFKQGRYKWPAAIPMFRAWRFVPPVDSRFLQDGLRRDARIRAVQLNPKDAERVLRLPRVEVAINEIQVANGGWSETDWTWLPSTEELVRHWRMQPPTDHRLKMLVTHYWSPNVDMDPSYLAAAMGWPTPGSAHLHYGLFASTTAKALGCSYPDAEKYDRVSLFARIEGFRGEIRWRMHDQVTRAIAELGWHSQGGPIASEGDVGASLFREGQQMSRVIKYRTRSGSIRQLCLGHHGARCKACGFEAATELGPDFAHLIDVHHLDPIAASMPDRSTDPVADCVPLCPTCHRLAHYGMPGGKCRRVDELRALRQRIPAAR